MAHLEDAIAQVLGAVRLRAPAKNLLRKVPGAAALFNRRDIRRRTRLVQEDELKAKYATAISLLQGQGIELGDYLEFGVYNGTSLCCMYHILTQLGNRHSRLIGFDSFEGLPPVAATDSGGHWRPGAFKSSLEFTCSVLDYEGVDWKRVILVRGYFDETLTDRQRTELQLEKASIIMVDCDLYQSTKEALEFCGPAIVDQSVVFFDDWYPLADRGMGEKKAFDEWLTNHPTVEARELFDFAPYGKAFLVSRVFRPG